MRHELQWQRGDLRVVDRPFAIGRNTLFMKLVHRHSLESTKDNELEFSNGTALNNGGLVP